jgi:hypothetical protein
MFRVYCNYHYLDFSQKAADGITRKEQVEILHAKYNLPVEMSAYMR